MAGPALAADDILDAIDAARRAYEAGELSTAKQSLDAASQLIGQKNAERFEALLPVPLPGWTADKPEILVGRYCDLRRVVGNPALHQRQWRACRSTHYRRFGASLVTQFAKLLINPSVGGIFGKIIKRWNTARATNLRRYDQHRRRRQVPDHGRRLRRCRRQARLRPGGRRRQGSRRCNLQNLEAAPTSPARVRRPPRS